MRPAARLARRAFVWGAAGLMVLGIAAFVTCFLRMEGAESMAVRAADAGILFVCIGAVVALSFVIWPGRA